MRDDGGREFRQQPSDVLLLDLPADVVLRAAPVLHHWRMVALAKNVAAARESSWAFIASMRGSP